MVIIVLFLMISSVQFTANGASIKAISDENGSLIADNQTVATFNNHIDKLEHQTTDLPKPSTEEVYRMETRLESALQAPEMCGYGEVLVFGKCRTIDF